MTISQDGWVDWAERVPGPPDKTYTQRNSAKMYLPHSAVGYYPGWASRLFDTSRLPNGMYTPNAAASVHFWIEKDGSVKQHYPIWASCWASGSIIPNTNGVAAENAGGPPGNVSEPLTRWQVEANVKLIQEISTFRGWTPQRPRSPTDVQATLYEHGECVRFGSAATACPSNRIPWGLIMLELHKEDVMTPEQEARIMAKIEASETDTKAYVKAQNDAILTFLKAALKNLDDDHTRIEGKLP